jgi:predicted MFS family arabinose efflux permease
MKADMDLKTNTGPNERIGEYGNPTALPNVRHAPAGSHPVPPWHRVLCPVSPTVVGLLAAGAAIMAAGSNFAGPVATMVGHDLGRTPALAGLGVNMGQIGYVLGRLFVAFLGGLVENRRFVAPVLLGSVTCLLIAALAPNSPIFLAVCFDIGISSMTVQMLVTLAALMSDPERRGRVVGAVTSGLLIGILLAWPTTSFVSAHLGWRTLFGLDAVIVSVLAVALFCLPPRRVPDQRAHCGALVTSLWELFRVTSELRLRAVGQAFLFGNFRLFWAVVLRKLRWHYAPDGDGLGRLGFVGGTGTLAAAVAAPRRDAGKEAIVRLFGGIAIAGASLLAAFAQQVWVLCLASIAIDAGVQPYGANLSRLPQRCAGRPHVKILEITDLRQISRLREQLDDRRIDILFVNAGIFTDTEHTVLDVTTRSFNRPLVTNALSPLARRKCCSFS